MLFESIPRHIPFYQARYKKGLSQDVPLTKKEINESFPSLWYSEALETALSTNQIEWAATSGTTSDRLQIVRPKNWWQKAYRWLDNELFPGQDITRRAVLTTALCSTQVCSMTQPSMEERAQDNALYLNTSHDPNIWTKSDVIRILKELGDWNPHYLLADPVYLLLLIKKVKKFELEVPQFSFSKIITGYELLTKFNRQIIQNSFPGCELRQLYGSTETGFHILEQRNGVLKCYHQEADLVLRRRREHIYEIYISSIRNPFMPLINYAIGDLVHLHSDAENIINPDFIHGFAGRTKDAVKSAQGFLCTLDFEQCLAQHSIPIAQYQLELLHQNLLIRYTTLNDTTLSSEDQEKVSKTLQNLLPQHKVDLTHCYTISPEPSGKFSIITNYNKT